jgi:hypothetical protein
VPKLSLFFGLRPSPNASFSFRLQRASVPEGLHPTELSRVVEKKVKLSEVIDIACRYAELECPELYRSCRQAFVWHIKAASSDFLIACGFKPVSLEYKK